jgi:hypothetical protein
MHSRQIENGNGNGTVHLFLSRYGSEWYGNASKSQLSLYLIRVLINMNYYKNGRAFNDQ